MKGLILAGGKSQRMGTDKAFVEVGGTPAYQYIKNIIAPFCQEIFISCNSKNAQLFQHSNLLIDPEDGDAMGPITGVANALNLHPESWLVVACDYLLLTSTDIEYLLQHRNPQKLATVFKNPNTGFIEPLIGIYESICKPIISENIAKNNHSLRHLLMENDTEIVVPQDLKRIQSIDTQEQYLQLNSPKNAEQ
ncbi:MAG: molybdenum cofactor guanylyltransferase [Bacteroidia bacterium]|nr:molybdenum cofactor guanylyltransferase [Bacteroidia bacterium]